MQRFNFEVPKMRDPKDYDWKAEFASLAETVRQSADGVIFMEPGMIMGLAKYAAQLESRKERERGTVVVLPPGNRLGETLLSVDEQVNGIISFLAETTGLSKQQIGENISHILYCFLKKGYEVAAVRLMGLGIILEKQCWNKEDEHGQD